MVPSVIVFPLSTAAPGRLREDKNVRWVLQAPARPCVCLLPFYTMDLIVDVFYYALLCSSPSVEVIFRSVGVDVDLVSLCATCHSSSSFYP